MSNNINADFIKAGEMPFPRWIPVTERLPEGKEKHWEDGEYPDTYYESSPVLVWARYTGYKVEEFYGIGTCFMDFDSGDVFDWDGIGFGEYDLSHQSIKVLAWMPLPEPYREEADNAQLD